MPEEQNVISLPVTKRCDGNELIRLASSQLSEQG